MMKKKKKKEEEERRKRKKEKEREKENKERNKKEQVNKNHLGFEQDLHPHEDQPSLILQLQFVLLDMPREMLYFFVLEKNNLVQFEGLVRTMIQFLRIQNNKHTSMVLFLIHLVH